MGLPQLIGPSDTQDTAKPNADGTRTYDRLKLIIRLLRACLLLAFLYFAFEGINTGKISLSKFSNSSPSPLTIKKNACQPPPPNLLAYHPPSAEDKDILKATQRLDQVLAKRVAKSNSGIDSLSVAVITSNGPIFERGYGVLRANESSHQEQHPVDRDSIYRIASVTKMITVLETLILRERGVLDWSVIFLDPSDVFFNSHVLLGMILLRNIYQNSLHLLMDGLGT